MASETENPQILGKLSVFDYLTNPIKTVKIGLIADIRIPREEKELTISREAGGFDFGHRSRRQKHVSASFSDSVTRH